VTLLLGCIADDFTGGSDLGNVLARSGARTIQLNGIPARPIGGYDAAIVALKTRSTPVQDAIAQSLAAFEWLRAAGCERYLFKYCSTFDSTPIGNIGPVADALLDAAGGSAAIVCPAFPSLRRSVYRGHLFVGNALLSESGMEHHPRNPMTDANLVRWLGLQTTARVGLITEDVVSRGAEAVRAAIDAAAGRGERLIVCDCIADGDLLALGAAVAAMPLVTGGSGIGFGIAEDLRRRGRIGCAEERPVAPRGRAVALSGSCSGATREQIAVHARQHPTFGIDAARIAAGEVTPGDAFSWIMTQDERTLPLVYVTPELVPRAAGTIEDFFGELARIASGNGVTRFIVAGGETSSTVVHALGVEAMRIGSEIDPGVPVLVTNGARPLALALKSGNFGAPDFFAKALRAFDGEAS
jgi:uncharacterized protein YgbK (DUF1537 family)